MYVCTCVPIYTTIMCLRGYYMNVSSSPNLTYEQLSDTKDTMNNVCMFYATSEHIACNWYEHVVCTKSGQRAPYDGMYGIVLML